MNAPGSKNPGYACAINCVTLLTTVLAYCELAIRGSIDSFLVTVTRTACRDNRRIWSTALLETKRRRTYGRCVGLWIRQQLIFSSLNFFKQQQQWIIITRKRGNCECIATCGRPSHASRLPNLITTPCQVWSRWTYPLPYCRLVAADTLLFTVTLTFDLWPLTINICSVTRATW